MAATSLQSGDLVTQLLAHATRQVEILNMELRALIGKVTGSRKLGRNPCIRNMMEFRWQLMW